MIDATTGSMSVTMRILTNGESILESNDPWFRLFRALADLYLSGEIELDELAEQSTHWLGSGPQIDHLREVSPAAAALEGKIALAWMEPDCLCDPYRDPRYTDPDCDHRALTDDERRARLRQLIGD